MINRCPVCGYNQLSRPPQDDTICPCCGTHFGYHDYATSYETLRLRWISNGARWFSRARQPPAEWNPLTQLLASGFAIQLTGGPLDEDNETITPEYDFPFDLAMKVVRSATA